MKCVSCVAAVGLVLAAAVAASAGPAVTGGLVFYYSFDDITTGTDVIVNDGSGNDMDGRVVTAASPGQTSSITFVPGVQGNCAQFNVSLPDDAANNDWAAIEIVNCWETMGEPEPLRLDGDQNYPGTGTKNWYAFQEDGDEPAPADLPTTGMTLAMWVNTSYKYVGDSTQATFCPSAYDPDANSSGGAGNVRAAWPYHLEVKNDGYRYTIRKDGGVGAGMQTIVSTNPVVNDYGMAVSPVFDTWSHIAWTYSQAQASWGFYIDGQKVASGIPESASPIYDNWDNGALLGLNVDIARQFIGQMDEVYMFKRALSDSEIALLATPQVALEGDLNGDGVVNSTDLDLIRGNWGTNNPLGDANDDGVVNSSDLDIVRANWGKQAAASAVPEPASLVLLGAMGLLACLIRRR